MNVRKKLKVGDIFLMPISEKLIGIGRITCKCKATFLCEYYMPITSEEEYNRDIILYQKVLFTSWVYSAGLKPGINEPLDFLEVSEDYQFSMFFGQSLFEKGIVKYYLTQGTNDCLKYITIKEISKEETEKYVPEGIGISYNFHINVYKKFLAKLGLYEYTQEELAER